MNNFNLWYENEIDSNCQIDDATYINRTIIDTLRESSIPVNIKTTTQELDPKDFNFYVIELCNVYNKFDIFSLIPFTTKKLFEKGLILLIYYPREGHELDEWFLRLYNNILANGLINFKIYFIFGDIDFKENYEKFLNKHNLENFLLPISIDYFAGDYLAKVDTCNLNIEYEKQYDYLFYNGTFRPHRLYAVSELSNKNILDYGLVSLTDNALTKESFTLKQCTEVLKQVGAYSTHLQQFVDNFEPIILDLNANEFTEDNINYTIISHYEQTYFSVISETNITTRFITEKIYKPIYNLHPFILIGAPRILEYLRSKGYVTFEEMFNENYDLELNPVKRVNLVISEIEKFTKKTPQQKKIIFDKIKPKLIHNRQHYMIQTKNNRKKELLKIFKKY